MKHKTNQSLIQVSQEDEHLLKRVWSFSGNRLVSHSKNGFVTLACLVLGASLKGFDLDHIDRNPYNNRHKNIRIVTRKANTLNHGKRSIHANRTSYVVHLGCNGNIIHIGSFKTYSEAASVYDKKHLELFKEELNKTRHLNQHLTDEEFYYYLPCQIPLPSNEKPI